jgi:hypothetical protein
VTGVRLDLFVLAALGLLPPRLLGSGYERRTPLSYAKLAVYAKMAAGQLDWVLRDMARWYYGLALAFLRRLELFEGLVPARQVVPVILPVVEVPVPRIYPFAVPPVPVVAEVLYPAGIPAESVGW